MRCLLLALAGCSAASPREGRASSAPPQVVLESAKSALQEHKDVEIEGLRITTSWGPERDLALEQGPLLGNPYKARVRYIVELEPCGTGTIVRVAATVERRAPGGARSLRWERVPSDGRFERELLGRLP